jgi:hypothetical protein
MIRLLTDLAVDTEIPAGPDNPLRQVIVNTHSPVCAAEVPSDSLLSAEPAFVERNGARLPSIRLAALAGTWRTASRVPSIEKGRLINYLKPVRRSGFSGGRVADRPEVQMELEFADE